MDKLIKVLEYLNAGFVFEKNGRRWVYHEESNSIGILADTYENGQWVKDSKVFCQSDALLILKIEADNLSEDEVFNLDVKTTLSRMNKRKER